jgi:hypothetical protein
VSGRRCRVERLEAHLRPHEVIHLWLERVRGCGDLDTYARAVLVGDEPPSRSFISDHVIAGASPGRKRDRRVHDEDLRVDLEDALVLYHLVLTIHEATSEVERHERLRLALHHAVLGTMDFAPSDARTSSDEPATFDWMVWRSGVHELTFGLELDDAARLGLEAWFMGGLSTLLPPLDVTWPALLDEARALTRIAIGLASLVPRPGEPYVGPDRAAIARRAHELLDDARVATFEDLGLREDARTLLRRRIASGAALRDPRPPPDPR